MSLILRTIALIAGKLLSFVANFFKAISDQGDGFIGEVTLRVELEDKDWWEKV